MVDNLISKIFSTVMVLIKRQLDIQYHFIITTFCLFTLSADEKLTDSLLLAESVMVVLGSRCGMPDAREAFVAAICKFALPSLFVLPEKREFAVLLQYI